MSIVKSNFRGNQKPEYIVTYPDSAVEVVSHRGATNNKRSVVDNIVEVAGKKTLEVLADIGANALRTALDKTVDTVATKAVALTNKPVIKPTPPSTRKPKPQPTVVPKSTPFVVSQPILKSNLPVMPKNSGVFSSNKVGRMAMRGVSQPAAKSVVISRSNKPRMSSRNGNLVISHSEMLGPVVSHATANTYSALSYIVNPGNVGAFPWLSTIACNFDKYRILQLHYTFVSNQPTTTAGRVGLGFDYDSTDVLPGDRPEFYTLTHHMETPPWQSSRFVVPVENTVKFVNSHTATDSKLIDAGQLVVMSDQIATSTANLGDVIVEYVVELIEPQQAIMQTMTLTGNNASPASFTASGPVLAKNITSNAASSTLTLEFQPGYYLIAFVLDDTGLGTPSITATSLGTATGRYTTAGGTAWQIFNLVVSVPRSGVDITFTCNIAYSACETAVLSISRVSSSIYWTGIGEPEAR